MVEQIVVFITDPESSADNHMADNHMADNHRADNHRPTIIGPAAEVLRVFAACHNGVSTCMLI